MDDACAGSLAASFAELTGTKKNRSGTELLDPVPSSARAPAFLSGVVAGGMAATRCAARGTAPAGPYVRLPKLGYHR